MFNVRMGMSVTRTALGLAGSVLVSSLSMTARPAAQAPSPFAALPLQVEAPPDNPTTPEKVALGRLLFWDPILSGAQDIACATCHHPDFGYADGRDLPIGTGGKGIGPKRVFPGGTRPLVKRNSPTILNAAFNGLVVAGPCAIPRMRRCSGTPAFAGSKPRRSRRSNRSRRCAAAGSKPGRRSRRPSRGSGACGSTGSCSRAPSATPTPSRHRTWRGRLPPSNARW